MATAGTPASLKELRETQTMVAADAGMGKVKRFFESQTGAIKAVLPKHVAPERMLRLALGALRTTPKLMNCTVESLMGAVIQCAQLGLEPNTPLGHAYLIPFDKRKKVGNQWQVVATEVQLIFGYKGLIDLARRSGQIVSIAAHEVCKNDEFEYEYGLDEKLVHRPALGDRGEVIAFYAVAKLVGGGHAFEVMSRAQIDAIRDEGQGFKAAVKAAENYGKTIDTPWAKHYVQMGRKTVLRRLFNYLPVSIEMATASALDGRAEAGNSQALDDVLQGEFTVVDSDGAAFTGSDEVNTETGEIGVTDPTSPPADDNNAPGLEDALAAIKSGDIDLAQDIARSLPTNEQAVVKKAIASKASREAAAPAAQTGLDMD